MTLEVRDGVRTDLHDATLGLIRGLLAGGKGSKTDGGDVRSENNLGLLQAAAVRIVRGDDVELGRARGTRGGEAVDENGVARNEVALQRIKADLPRAVRDLHGDDPVVGVVEAGGSARVDITASRDLEVAGVHDVALLLHDVRSDDRLGTGHVGRLHELAVVLHAALEELRDGLFLDAAHLGLGGTGVDGLEILLISEGGELVQRHGVERGASEGTAGPITDLGDLRQAVSEVGGHVGLSS